MKNIGIITGGTVVINGDMTVGDNKSEDGNVGIIATGDGNVVVNGAFNVGGNTNGSQPKGKAKS